MAYNIEYYHAYYDINGTYHKVDLLLKDYSGGATAIDFAEHPHPTRLRHKGSKTEIEKTIIQGQEFVFSFYVHRDDADNFDSIFESDYKDYKIKYYVGAVLTFEGYVKSENLSKEYSKNPPYMHIVLSATDALADLKEIAFGDGTILSEKMTILEVLKEALSPTGLDLEFEVQLGTYESDWMISTDCALKEIYVDSRRFFKNEQGRVTYKSCWEVIEIVLKDFNVNLKQFEGAYKITNFHEVSSYEFIYDWATLTQQSRGAVDISVDVSLYKFGDKIDQQKIRPLKTVGVTFRNKDMGGDVTGFDLDDWDNASIWTIDFSNGYVFDSSSETVTLNSNDDTYDDYVQTADFSVTKVTENDYIKLTFDHYLSAIVVPGLEDAPLIKVELIRPDLSSEFHYISAEEYWNTYESGINLMYRVTESGDHSVKLSFKQTIGFRGWTTASFQLKQFRITAIINPLEVDDMDDVTFDVHYRQESGQGIEVFETETLLADSYQITEIGALLYDNSGSWTNTGVWRTYGQTEDIKLLDIYARNILNNRYAYKNFLRTTIYDPNRNVDFNAVLTFDSRSYVIISYDRDFKSCWVSMELVELLTTQQTYSTLLVVTLDSVDGQEVRNATNVSYTSPTNTPAHNQLTGLNGLGPDYYHLDSSEYTELAVWLSQMSMDSAATQVENITLYGDVYLNNDGDSSGGHEQRFIYWGDDTYIHEYTDDVLRIVCNDALIMTLDETDVLISVDLEVLGGVEINGTFFFTGGVAVDTIEVNLTEDDTHLPTSGAVYDAIAAENLWDKSGAVLSPHTANDTIKISAPTNQIQIEDSDDSRNWYISANATQLLFYDVTSTCYPFSITGDNTINSVLRVGGNQVRVYNTIDSYASYVFYVLQNPTTEGSADAAFVRGETSGYATNIEQHGTGGILRLRDATTDRFLFSQTGVFSINDTNTQIWEDGSGNLTFKDAVAGTYTLSQLGGGYWDRSSAGVLSPITAGDEIAIDIINEEASGVGVTIESVLLKDGNIGESTDYQGIVYILARRLQADANYTNNYAKIYSDTPAHSHVEYYYRYGGSVAVPAAAQSNSYIARERGYVWDGTAARQVTEAAHIIDGTVATDNVAGRFYWNLRPTGVAASLTLYMELNQNGLEIDIINELSSGVGITVDSVLLKDGGVTLGTGPAVDTIETSLTDDDTHLPTSGAVFDAVASVIGAQISGTPADNQVAVWTNATTIEGATGLTWDGSNLRVSASTQQIEIEDSDDSRLWSFNANSTLFFIYDHTNTCYPFQISGNNTSNSVLRIDNNNVRVYNAIDSYALTLLFVSQNPTTEATADTIWFRGETSAYTLTIDNYGTGNILKLRKAGGNKFLFSDAGVLSVDTIDELTGATGVTIESVKIEDGTLYTSLTNMTFQDASTGPHTLSDLIGVASHSHGNITNAGAIGAVADLPIITTGSGVLTTGTFGTSATSFCEGDDARLSDSRTPTQHAMDSTTYHSRTDVTVLNASTSFHGFLPKLSGTSTEYIDGSGSWSTPAGGVTPAALTRTNDTNVTLTLGGTPATALLQATSLTLGWTGTLADGRITSAATWSAKSDITMDGTTANGIVTYGGVDNIDVEANLTFSGSAFIIAATTSFGGHTYPTLTSQYTLGTSSLYWTNTHTDQVTLATGIVLGYGGSDMTFVDGVTSSKTLAELAAGGSDTYVQFNDGGSAFGGSANFTWDDNILKATNTAAHAAWADYPTALPVRYSIRAERGSAISGSNNYNGIVIHAQGAGSYDSYAFLGVKAITTIDNKAEFNLMLSGAAGTDFETVFSARYDSVYYWKASSTAVDIRHALVQNGTSIAVWGWDDSGAGFQIEEGTGFTTAPAIFIGSNNHLAVGAQTDNATYELYVTGEIYSTGDMYATDFNLTSDPRLKDTYGTFTDGLDTVMKLNPVTYRWKDHKDDFIHVGFLTTEVEKIRPELVKYDDQGYGRLSYAKITALNTAAIQGLNIKVESVESQLRSRIKKLEKQVKQLEDGRST